MDLATGRKPMGCKEGGKASRIILPMLKEEVREIP